MAFRKINTRKNKKQNKHRRKYTKGGFKNKIDDIDFKYTRDMSRIIWTKNAYPNHQQLIDIIANISWDEYTYEGPVVISQYETISDNAGGKMNDSGKIEYAEETILVDIKEHSLQTNKGIDYNFFGGICYELLDDVFNNVNLSLYVDPTGDIDVALNIPYFGYDKNKDFFDTVYDNHDKSYCHDVIVNNEMNPYYRNVVDWIVDKLRIELSKLDMNRLYPNSVDFHIDEYTEIPTAHKTQAMGFNDIKIGNAHILSFINHINEDKPNNIMIKIQLVIKIVDDDITIIDHVLECVISIDKTKSIDLYKPSLNKTNVLNISGNNYNIEGYAELVEGNLRAYIERKIYIDNDISEYIHKPYNHVGRLFYLFELFKFNKDQIFTTNKKISDEKIAPIISTFQYYIQKAVNQIINAISKNEKKIDTTQKLIMYQEYFSNYIFNYISIDNDGTHNIGIRLIDFIEAYIDVFNIHNNYTFSTFFNYNISDEKLGDITKGIDYTVPYMNDKYNELKNIFIHNYRNIYSKNITNTIVNNAIHNITRKNINHK
uniref:Uncharacterized protein n=1 Tax=viral metagenome TaxID=1070528 RepID=A0A6C0HBH5_9ZZZZ